MNPGRILPGQVTPGKVAQTKPWTVLSQVDATHVDTEPWAMRKLGDSFEAGAADHHLVAQVRRKPSNKWLTRALGAAQLAGAVAIPAAALLWPPLLLGALFSPVLALSGLNELGRANLHRDVGQQPDWRGTRTYNLGDGQLLEASDQTRQPSTAQLVENLTDKARQFPSRFLAVNLAGHGGPTHYGGVAKNTVTEGLLALRDQRGKKVELLLLEQCRGASLEVLQHLAPTARFIVASEDLMNVTGLPSGSLAKALGDDPRQSAQKLVQLAGGRSGPLSAIDTHHIPLLAGRVDNLGEALGQALENGHRSQILDALAATTPLAQAPGPLGAVFNPLVKLRDLGEVLQQLDWHCTDPAVKQAVEATRQVLEQTVVAQRTDHQHRGFASGISIHLAEPGYCADNHMALGAPPNWARFLKQTRPWPMRRFGDAVLRHFWPGNTSSDGG
ncbi:MAG: hypothetical protein AB7S38_08315 [Vulcanimicrobiota bacterium]